MSFKDLEWQYGKKSWVLMIVNWCIVEMQTPCLDDPAVWVSVDFATILKYGTNPRMIRSVVQSQGMEIGNVIWIEIITREEPQNEQRCDPFLSPVISWLEP